MSKSNIMVVEDSGIVLLVQNQDALFELAIQGSTGCLKTAHTLSESSFVESFLPGSITFLLACIQRGSIGLSQGLFFGKRTASSLVPVPVRLTS